MNGATQFSDTEGQAPRISVVLPLFNERAVLRQLLDDIIHSLRAWAQELEIIFVNDGSSDGSATILDRLAARDPRVRVLHLSRNFGHQAAVQAGLTHARGEAVIVMDSDLQDDPGCLPDFIRHWERGYDVVYAVRTKRKERWGKRILFYAFYRLLNAVSNTPVPNDAGNFGLVSRRVVQQLLQLGEYDRYYPGLRQWVGFPQVGIPVERAARHDGTPRVSLRGLFQLAKTALFSFSATPLALFYAIAALALVLFAAVGAVALYAALVVGHEVPGWTATVLTGALLSAINALGIAVLGEYIARIYDQVRGRPGFIVARQENDPALNCSPPAAETDTVETLAADAAELQVDMQQALQDVPRSVEAV